MSKKEREIIDVAISDIKPHDGSHNTDDTVQFIKESIEKYGIQQPISIDSNKVIVTGNAVYKAAKLCGLTTIPCIVLDDLTQDKINQYRIADNKTSEFSRWNEAKLKKELSYLESPSSLQFCFDMSINAMLGLSNPIPKSRIDANGNITPMKPSKPKKEPTEEQKDKAFREQLAYEEQRIMPKAPNYLEYTCSKCGKKVAVKI